VLLSSIGSPCTSDETCVDPLSLKLSVDEIGVICCSSHPEGFCSSHSEGCCSSHPEGCCSSQLGTILVVVC